MNHFAKLFYRPTENHVGVLYRFGRFRRFVDPDRWALTLPWIDTVFKETKLDIRTALISLKDVYTRERIAVDVDFKVFYQVDLRSLAEAHRLQVLRFPTEIAWEEIVRTAVNDITRNIVFLARSFDELNSKEGRAYLKGTLSGEVANRVRGFGILINPRFGVNIADLQPNEEFRKALMEESAAGAVGSAAVARLNPLLERIIEQTQEKAISTLIMQIASAVARNGTVPDVLFPNPNEYPAGGIAQGNGQGSTLPRFPSFPPQPGRPKSVAGD
jgi:regulator of protease activity HflC (stomatin/prohibitin superfamily)